MFFHILKKDLKRGRTMNTIILLFVIISVMFISGSVNSMISVTSSLDNYFENAGIPEVMCATYNRTETQTVEKVLENDMDRISKIEYEPMWYMDHEDITFADGKETEFKATIDVMPISGTKLSYFDENKNKITEVKKGEVLVANKFENQGGIKVGDTLKFKLGKVEKKFKVAGKFYDAAMGSALMGNGRMILNGEDAEPFMDEAEKKGVSGKFYFISTDSADDIIDTLNESDLSFAFCGKREFIKSSYIFDMIIALLLLVVSAILIIVALIVLRFTISFTISSEFREIGVMKAIGLGNLKIRSQYLVKYLAISAVGAVIGTALSFPFGNLLTDISSNSVMVENEGSVFTNIICAIAVIAVIMLFAFICTRKANKLSPVDAIRNGQTGERFKRKGFLHLSKSRLGTTTFMAANDVMSAPKRFLIIIVVFALTILPIQFLDICADTLNNKQMLSVLGCVPSDVAFSDNDNSYQYTTDGSGRQMLIDKYKKMEQTLADNGIPARVFCEQFISCKQEFNGKTAKALSLQGVNNKASEHKITKGSAPQNKDEIAIQPNTANDLGGAEIGDTITVTIGDKKYDLIISGFYEAMTNMGQGIRFHEGLDINYNFSNGTFGGQIQFTDDPSDKEIDDRIEKIKDLFPDLTDIKTGAEQAQDITSVGPVFDTLKFFFLILSAAIVIMVAVLMERSMVIKETSEIATMKAIGFKDSKIIKLHTKRFIITAVISAVISGLLALPVSKLIGNQIFSIMGVNSGITYSMNTLRVAIIYPVAIMALMAISVWITAAYTKRITAQQTSSIE